MPTRLPGESRTRHSNTRYGILWTLLRPRVKPLPPPAAPLPGSSRGSTPQETPPVDLSRFSHAAILQHVHPGHNPEVSRLAGASSPQPGDPCKPGSAGTGGRCPVPGRAIDPVPPCPEATGRVVLPGVCPFPQPGTAIPDVAPGWQIRGPGCESSLPAQPTRPAQPPGQL